MSIKQFPGGIITKNPTAPTTSAAKGIWTLDQASNYAKQGIWPRSPGAPTIGTATQASATSVTVTYTAPSDLGTGSATFTATSNPGGVTGTGASPITVSGLTTGTAYTFAVSASTPGGTGPSSAASNSVTPTATVPGAPTIGTATATGSTTATVAYTAPASDGGATITTYTATSSPGGLTGTLNQAGSGTITVSGLTGATSYTFTVKATNSVGQSAASAASNSITTVPVIGQAFGGGFFCGQISTAGNGVADYNLVLGPKSSTQATGPANRTYKDSNSDDPGATSVSDGAANSDSINNFGHQAVYFCRNLNVGGFTDWYLPAKNEFEICYYNLKPSNQSNDTTSGVNTNAVPSRGSFYTAGNPAVTPIADFTNDSGTNNLNISPYWTSTQANIATAWRQSPANGLQGNYNKTNGNYVRAFRRVAV